MDEEAGPPESGQPAAPEEARLLHEEVRRLAAKVEECKRANAAEVEALEGKMQDIRQKARDHLKQLTEKMQTVIQSKDLQLEEVQGEKAALLSELDALRSSGAGMPADGDARTGALEKELAELRAQLQAREVAGGGASGSGDAITAEPGAAAGEVEQALRVRLQEQERQIAEMGEEMARLRQESDSKMADVVRKAKEHVQQVQGRLQDKAAESKDLAEKHRELDELYKQQQEKVTKYKQLMAQANSRIEELDAQVGELREALSKSQSQRMSLQQQMGSIEKKHFPPTQAEIAERGGVLIAVEADNDDVWCLINQTADGEDGADEEEPRQRWWLLSQLDLAEKPIPLQRRWKGEASALRAQMTRFKKRSEELQEAFDSYKNKANAAMQSGASQGEEIQALERKVEKLGEQLLATSTDLQAVQAERDRAFVEVGDVKKKLQEALSQRGELEAVLDRRVREAEARCEASAERCRGSFEAEKQALEQRWREKERAYQKELDLRKAQKESLDEEIEGLRARLASRLAAAMTAAEPAPPVAREREVDATSLSSQLLQRPSLHLNSGAMSEGGCDAQLASTKSTPRTVSSALPEPAAEPSLLAAALSTGPSGPPPAALLAPAAAGAPATQGSAGGRQQQAHGPSLHDEMARQDMAALRSQVRQLEQSVSEERQQHAAARREAEALKTELRDVTMQQRLQETIGDHQQMEYIRNVFKKFVEKLPQQDKEHEQLIPVLMTFFKFQPDETKAMQARRVESKPQGFWNSLPGWRG